jgi:regulator of protease activity HflC (stomatin/prohibitin superfamily)
VIDSVQLENIDFSDAYEKSIELRMQAEVLVQTEKQNLEKEKVNAEIAVTQAKGQAESNLARAARGSRSHAREGRGGGLGDQGTRRGAGAEPEPDRADQGRALGRQAADHDDPGLHGALHQRR